MNKFLRNTLLVVLTLLAFKTANMTVYAANEHAFSFKAYTCSGGVDTDEAECLSDPVALTNNSAVQKGQIIQLDLWYKPDLNPCTMMQVGVTFNGSVVEIVKNEGQTVILEPTPEGQDGIYPNRPGSTKRTNWELDSNDDANNLWLVIEDSRLDQPLENEGVLTRVFFTVKEDATAGDVFNFAYDDDYTLLNSRAPFTSQGISLKVFKLLDTDTSLKALTVTSGSTNYLTSFSPTTKTYTVYVPNNVSSVTVTGTPNKETTTAINDPDGAQSLTVSTTKTVNIFTTAESGDVDTYTVNIYRLDNNANLSALSLGSGVTLTPTFASGTTSYTASVPYTTSSVNVSATKVSSKASVSGTGNKNLTAGGVTNVSVTVTPENCGSAYSSVPGNTCITKTYTVAVTRAAASTNANLSDLKVDGTTVPSFSQTTYNYNLPDVVGSKSSVNITATLADSTATIVSGTGSKNLSYGNNKLDVVVTAQDGSTTRTYSINIKRLYDDATLNSLSVTSSPSGTLSPATFNPTTKTYTYTVGPDVTAVNITGTSNKNAAITGNGTYNPQEVTKAEINVTSEDNTATNKYTVNLVRTKSTDTTLQSLTVSGYQLSPSYSDSVNSYTVTVPSTETSVNVTAVPNDSRTTATITGGTNLSVGNNTVTVTVTPENGTSSARTITITVKKLAGVATLSNLTLSNVTYAPAFDSNTIDYTATVPYTTTKTKLTSTLSDNKASKTVTYKAGTSSEVALTENTDQNLAVGANTFKVKVVAEDTNVTKTYTVVVTREAPSTNNYLSNLSVDNETVNGFVKTNNGPYNLTVGYDKTKVNIAAIAEDTEFAVVAGDIGEQNLNVGDNTFRITVTPQDPNTQVRTYTIVVHRQSNNTNLGSLTVTSNDGALAPTFNPDTLSYTYTVGPDVTEVNIAATKGDNSQTSITGTGTYNPQEVSKAEIVVTAEDTTKTKTYTVNFERNKSVDVSLDELSILGESINPAYSDSVNSYNVTVKSDVNSVDVTAIPHDSRTTASISGGSNLTVGNNTVTVTLTPEAGSEYKRVITITVKKLSGNADLSNITLSDITLTPAFTSSETSYSVAVPYTTTKTKLASTLSDNKASKSVTIDNVSYTENSDANLKVGANTFKITVTAEDTDITKTYTVVINRSAASNDAYLTDLSVDGATVDGFNGNSIYSYNLTVGSDVSSIVIAAVPNETSVLSTDSDVGTKSLNVGENTFSIVVVAQNGETRIPYELHVTRLSGDNNLNSLSITSSPQGTLEPATFNSDTLAYTYTVGPDVTNVTVSGTLPTGASATGFGSYNPQNESERSITVSVSAEDPNVTPKVYTITLARTESSINTLSDIKVDGESIPGFDPDTTSYTVDVPSDTDSVNITATPEDGDREHVTVSGPDTLVVGDNTFTITAEAEDGTTKEYTVTVHKKNDDNTLSSLSLDNVTLVPDFDPDVTTYTATVPFATTSTGVNATASDSSLTPVITGDEELQVGDNVFTITVVPEDETKPSKTYTVTVTRSEASSDAYLTDLSIDNETVTGFDKDVTSYTVTVPHVTSSVNITATANENSVVTGDVGNKALSVGDNRFTITATAQDGETRLPYTLVIKRLDSNNNLGSLTITSDPQGTLDQDFDPDVTEYTYTVGPNTGDITVTADPDGNANVDGTGTFDPEETDKVTITVTPEDGEPKVYTINVVRTKSTDNTLVSLGVQGYQITPDFSNDVPAYTLTVGKEIENATIIAEEGEAHQTITGLGLKELAKGENPFTITVQSEDTSVEPRVFTITITREKSSIKTLDGISVDGVPVEGFSSDTPNYDIGTVGEDVTTINISATPTDPLSQVAGTGDITLQPGNNVIPITVTPEDGSEPETYTITVYRTLNTNNYLASLTVNGVSVPNFNKETQDYSVNVPIDATTVDIDGTPEVETSVVVGKGNAINLNTDDTPTVITISVIPQSGDQNARNYTVTVTKVDDAEFITSVIYGHTIADGMIKTVARQTTSSGLKDQLDNDNAKLFNYKLVGTEEVLLEDTEFAGTGVIVKLISNGTLKDSKIVIVKGDTNGDGNITLFDAIKIFSHLIDSEHLEGAYAEAADVDSNGAISLFDAIQIFQILLQ